MKKVLVTIVLALTTGALAQGTAQQPPAQQPADQANVPTSQKVIKDPAEYNAYITALNMTDPAAKAQAMENFIKQYPNSIVKIDALEQAMAAYQTAGNQPKVEETASRILEISPNNVRALAIVTFIERIQATQAQTPQQAAALAQKARVDGERGLQSIPTWQKPEGMSDADFEKLKNQMTEIFAGAAGFGALQAKDYAAAKAAYLKSVQIDPSNLQDIYQLGIASLESSPLDVNGFWYIAKAMSLAQAQNNPQAVQGIERYGKAKYHKYHGADDGWPQVVAAGAQGTAPPANFAASIKPAPTPQELACLAVEQNDPATLGFADWEYILQYRDAAPCNKEAAAKVWAAIQAKEKGGEAKLSIPVKVIAVPDNSTLDVAVSDENQAANKSDMKVQMEKPMTKPPAVGSTTNVIGVITDYVPQPFTFVMTKGELPAPKAPAKKPTPARRPGAARRG